MGVPKFFRYISERYPCLSEKLKEYQIPEFDNLYLDMNGIIHNCSHPNDADVSFRITEETIFKNIFHYIEILFRIIQPQKLFFMAVDGVAPRAKINQQRGRRFRAAKDAEVQEAKARAKGQEIPKEARFDSNCITPGTVFMAKLNEQLKYFITYKISTDKLWQRCKIILSGSEVPGEGEHKIMDYIRYMKAQLDYDGNTRHCLYGLDADLIMLGLCSHEPHFSLLREEVKFGKAQKKILTPEETNFCLLHLSLMREYLEHEFLPVKDKLNFKFDIEKIIDDWVLMGFLVGNDFIPHLPNLHIENGALPILYNAYMEVLPYLDGYINEGGTLNLDRFEKFMEKLGNYDMEQFDEIYADLKFFEAKTGRRLNETERSSKSSPDENASPKRTTNKALESLIMATEAELGESDDDDDDAEEESDEDTDMHLEFVQHKRDYYMNKMEYENIDSEIMRSQAEGYIRAIQWNLNYYYNGCCSWSWYYPHHYAPFISDIKNFKDLKIEFDMGVPFNPFEQLLAVLPAASKNLLPQAYHGLMTEEKSPIIKYYPLDFKTDLNGKKQEWEAVVLIPLIDEKNLLDAMEPCNRNLTMEERKRNQHGPMSIFTYTEKEQGFYEAPEYFPSIRSYAQMILVNREEILVPKEKLVKGLCKGVRLSVYYPGFPTLQHIPHSSCLVKAKVKVFEQPSRRENMILTIMPREMPALEELARKWIGKSVFVCWPHLIEAFVVGVSNSKSKISIMHPQSKQSDGNMNFNIEKANDQLISAWNVQRKSIIENYKNRLGIDVGDVEILIHACPIVGRQYVYGAQGKMTLEKQWNDIAMAFAYQVVLYDIAVHNQDFIQYKSITDVFKPKTTVFMLGHPHYGAIGEVTDSGVDLKTTRVKVAMKVMQEPNFDRVKQLQADTRMRYMPGNIAAQRLGISSHLLSRITGTIYVINGEGVDPSAVSKHNIGLNLKFNKKNEEVPGFTKKDNNGVWLYSVKAVDLVRTYMKKFPDLFGRLEQNLLSSDMFLKEHLFPEGNELADETVTWIKEQQKALGTTTRACGVEELDPEIVQGIEHDVDETSEERQTCKTVFMQVKPHLLYKPNLNSRSVPPDPKAHHRLFDRIICVRESFTVPVGYKGTIVGIQKGENILLNMYEVLFDKPFAGGLIIHGSSPNRSYRLAPTDFINISYGIQIENKNTVTNINPGLATNWRFQQQQQQQQSPNYNNPRTPDHSWRQPQPQQILSHPHNIPPNPSTLNRIYPQFTKNGQNNSPQQNKPQPNNTRNKVDFNESPNHGRKPEPQQTQFPPVPTLLQRIAEQCKNLETPSQQPNPQNPQNVQQAGPKTQTTSEFQALWNELHKIQKPTEQYKNPASPPVKDKPNPQPVPTKDSPQDPSAFLKAMLKISDDNSQSNKPSFSSTTTPPTNKPLAFPQMSKATDTPPLVQQMFDHARQAEMKSGKSIYYCSQLLSYFQLLGTGFPRYVYCQNKDNLVCAQIILPDMRTFCGEFCQTHSEAAENAAKKVYEELKLDKARPPNVRAPNPLRPPPQQWFNNRVNNVRLPVPPPIKPILPAGFPQVMPMQIPMPKWTPMMQQNHPVPFGAMPGQQPPHLQHPQHPQQQQQRYPQPPLGNKTDNRTNRQQEPLKKTASSERFVPLQAQKKTRNPSSRQGSTEDPKPQQKQTQQQVQQQPKLQQKQQQQKQQEKRELTDKRVEQKPKENVSLENKQDKSSSNNKATESAAQNSGQSQNSQKNQRSVAKQRRSRVAAKFQSDSMANGGDRQ